MSTQYTSPSKKISSAMDRSCEPFFIVGAQRSGTTMLRLMLNSHPNLFVPFESKFITEYYRRLEEYGDLSEKNNIHRLLQDIAKEPFVKKGKLIENQQAVITKSISTYAELISEIFSTAAQDMGKIRWGDKTPSYVTEIDIIHKLFPNAKIIHLVRDGRDVAVSLSKLDWGTTHIPRLANDWRWKTILAHKMGAMLNGNYLEIKYEQLVKNPRIVLQKICDFLDEPYSDEMLQYTDHAQHNMPSESLKWHKTSIQPPTTSRMFVWKHSMSKSDQIIFEQIAGDALAIFGYQLTEHPPTIASKLKNLYYTLIKRW